MKKGKRDAQPIPETTTASLLGMRSAVSALVSPSATLKYPHPGHQVGSTSERYERRPLARISASFSSM